MATPPELRPLSRTHRHLARLGLVALALAAVLLLFWSLRRAPRDRVPPPGDGGLRAATFNIRNYPESERQRTAALETIGELGVSVVALQEITAPEVFDAEAARVLGRDWATVYALLPGRARGDEPPFPAQNLGLLYDQRRFVLRSVRVHPLLPGRGKPALEVHLSPREPDDGRELRVFNVHLKAYDEGLDERRAQLRALSPIVAAAARTGDRVVLLGDFNSTRPEDRTALEQLAAETGLVWASRELRCTEYWDPKGSDRCQASPLDHVFSDEAPAQVEALGPCRELDCSPDRCPLFYREVSDHCPVTVRW